MSIDDSNSYRNLAWIHLSDLHFRDRGLDRADREQMLDALVDDAAAKVREHGFALDCMFVTGDVAFSGQAREYGLAGEFLRKVSHALSISRERIFIVPGNHDANRSQDSAIATIHAAIIKDTRLLSDILARPEESRSRGLLFEKFKAFAEFVAQECPQSTITSDIQCFVAQAPTGLPWLSIVGLNSAIKSEKGQGPNGEELPRSLVLGRYQLQEALRVARSRETFTVGLMHHPPSWLLDEGDVRDCLREQFDILLLGHEHDARFATYSGPHRLAVEHPAGSAYAGSDYRNAYAIASIRVQVEPGRCPTLASGKIVGRQWSSSALRWGPDTHLGEQGVYHWQRPSPLPDPGAMAAGANDDQRRRRAEYLWLLADVAELAVDDTSWVLLPESRRKVALVRSKLQRIRDGAPLYACPFEAPTVRFIDEPLSRYLELYDDYIRSRIASGSMQLTTPSSSLQREPEQLARREAERAWRQLRKSLVEIDAGVFAQRPPIWQTLGFASAEACSEHMRPTTRTLLADPTPMRLAILQRILKGPVSDSDRKREQLPESEFADVVNRLVVDSWAHIDERGVFLTPLGREFLENSLRPHLEPSSTTAKPAHWVRLATVIASVAAILLGSAIVNRIWEPAGSAPRHLTDLQKETLRDSLRKSSNHSVFLSRPIGDREAREFSLELKAVLVDSGWTIEDELNSWFTTPGPVGVEVRISRQLILDAGTVKASAVVPKDAVPLSAFLLLRALKEAGIPAELKLGDVRRRDAVELLVGYRPVE